MKEAIIKPIGFIKNDFKEKFGIPRQSQKVKNISTIEFCDEFNNIDAFRGLEKFSHIWILFDFSKNHRKKFNTTVRPPRLGGNKRVGVFASRSPFRPNNIGISVVKLLNISNNDNKVVITVEGADILDETPIYDIKPYIPYCDAVLDAKGSYSDDFKDYHINVEYDEETVKILPENKRQVLIDCIKENPTPSYKNSDKTYKMKFDKYDVEFKVKNDVARIISIK